MPFRALVATIVLLTGFLVSPVLPQDEPLGQQGQVWNLGRQLTGKTFPTTVTVFNQSCPGKRDFKVSVEGEAAAFLKITGPPVIEKVKHGTTKLTEALLDLRGIAAGTYNSGTVEIRCQNCPATCSQDYQILNVHLTVLSPCPKDTSPCDELLKKAEAAETEAAIAQARRRRARRRREEPPAGRRPAGLQRQLGGRGQEGRPAGQGKRRPGQEARGRGGSPREGPGGQKDRLRYTARPG